MESKVDTIFAFMSDIETSKLVERRAYVSDVSRHENSAEHSWNMAIAVADRFLPFMTNLITKGQTWREQQIKRSQVLAINQPVREQAPEIYDWMLKRIDEAVANGWLLDGKRKRRRRAYRRLRFT